MYSIMKKRIVLLMLGAMLVLSGCGDNEDAKATTETSSNNVDETTTGEESEETTEDNGYIIEYSENGVIKYVRDQDRTLIEKHFLRADGTLRYYEVYDYDEESGLYTGRTLYDTDGKVTHINTFEHDENGFESKYYIYSPDMELEQIGTYTRDENGKLLKITFTLPDGRLIEIDYYDSEGRVVRIEAANGDGDIIYRCGYEYDDKDRVIKDIMYYSHDNGEEYIDYYEEYKLDDHNNKIEIKTYSYSYQEDKCLPDSHRTYEYDEQYREIRKNNHSLETGEITSYSITEYSEGKVVKTNYSKDGVKQSSHVTEYLDGMTRETDYNADGTQKRCEETYYDENGETKGFIWYDADGNTIIDTMAGDYVID